MWQTLIDEVRQQHAFLDLYCSGWISDYTGEGKRVYCGRGCNGCCTLAVNGTLTEALLVGRNLSAQQEGAVAEHIEKLKMVVVQSTDLKSFLRLHRSQVGLCPLVAADGSCSIYNSRPLSCRSLLSTRESSWCSTDFSALSPVEKEAYLASLDRGAVTFPSHYAGAPQELAHDLETAAGDRMGKTFGFSLYGNFPVLLFLVRVAHMEQIAMQGVGAVRAALMKSGFDHPFLVNLDA